MKRSLQILTTLISLIIMLHLPVIGNATTDHNGQDPVLTEQGMTQQPKTAPEKKNGNKPVQTDAAKETPQQSGSGWSRLGTPKSGATA